MKADKPKTICANCNHIRPDIALGHRVFACVSAGEMNFVTGDLKLNVPCDQKNDGACPDYDAKPSMKNAKVIDELNGAQRLGFARFAQAARAEAVMDGSGGQPKRKIMDKTKGRSSKPTICVECEHHNGLRSCRVERTLDFVTGEDRLVPSRECDDYNAKGACPDFKAKASPLDEAQRPGFIIRLDGEAARDDAIEHLGTVDRLGFHSATRAPYAMPLIDTGSRIKNVPDPREAQPDQDSHAFFDGMDPEPTGTFASVIPALLEGMKIRRSEWALGVSWSIVDGTVLWDDGSAAPMGGIRYLTATDWVVVEEPAS